MSSSYSVCEDVMNRFSSASDQEDACLNGKFTGTTNGEPTCKWTECSMVGYCVDTRDVEYFQELKTQQSSRRLSVDIDREEVESDWSWGNGKPTNPPKTPRPTVWKAPKTPKPSNPPKTPRPTNPPVVKTPRPTNTPRPTPIKTTKVKTPKPTEWKAPKTPKPTNPPKSTKGRKTPRPTDTPRPTPIKTTKVKTPRPTNTPRPTPIKT